MDYNHLKLLAENREFDELTVEAVEIKPQGSHMSRKQNGHILLKNAQIGGVLYALSLETLR